MTTDSNPSRAAVPQYLPDYTYVPGISPHPVSDTRGHAFGAARPVATGSLRPGKELFDYGFYWEAHEVWEAEWLAAGRIGPCAAAIKGLIKLAACGVKCLEQNLAGARRHARRAEELFQVDPEQVRQVISAEALEQLKERTREILSHPPLATLEQQQASTRGGVPLLGPLPELLPQEH